MEIRLLKWLFPLIFLCLAGAAHAQQDGPEAPIFDPQGRLIPYDAKKPPVANEQRKSAKSPKVSTAKSGQKLRNKSSVTAGKKARQSKRVKPATADGPPPRKSTRVKRQRR